MIWRQKGLPHKAQTKIFLIGPLPPPFGGARASFELFWQFLHTHQSTNNVTHLDLPVRHCRYENPPGSVNHFRTLLAILRNLFSILKSKKLIIFGSRNFCFSYGILLIALCHLSHVMVYLRFFGGHPFQELRNKASLIQNIALYFLQKSEKIIVQTRTGTDEFPEVLHEKIVVIPGYRLNNHNNKTFKYKEDKGKWKFVYVGRISQSKGIEDLLNAYSALLKETDKIYELHLYGALSGNVSLTEEYGSVIYHGSLPNSEVLANLSMYDALIFPSKYSNEGHPGVIIEAFMKGLPIIGTKLATICEMIADGENGILIDPGDVQQLKAAMFKISHDKTLGARLSRESLKSFTKYDAERLLPLLAKTMGLPTTQ